jgi:hypothetical protein
MPRLLLAPAFVLLLLATAACEQDACPGSEGDRAVALGYPGMGDWLAIADGDDVLVAPGSQGWGLMVEVNIRIDGLSNETGSYSTAEVHITRRDDEQDQLTAPGTRVLAALCQDDDSLLSRNRRVEFSDEHMTFDELPGIDDGFDAILEIRVEFADGTRVSQELDVHLYRDPPESAPPTAG